MGLKPFPSEANMILVQMPDAPAAFAGLQSRGVLVKNVSHQHPLLAHCLRLTVGTPHENDCLISALKDLL
jgi:histidinol-phosphate aminotransferase